MKIIVAPDKFKGSLTSLQLCFHIRQGVLSKNKNAHVHIFPMSDGGDGFAEVMKHYLHTHTVSIPAADPLGRSVMASYECDVENKTAIIELAAASGLSLLEKEEQNPLYTSTFGTGMLVKHAVDNGFHTVVLGLGGSATTDAGMGILSALGFEFTDGSGVILKPVGENLRHIQKITYPLPLPAVEFIVAADVNNVLCGKEGAAYVFAPQKGAGEKEVQLLDAGLEHFAALLQAETGNDIASIAGGGAAGGVAAGLSAFFKVSIVSGAALVLDKSGIGEHIAGAGMVITGEGKLDEQTGKGKVIQHIASLSGRHRVPVVALCGSVSISKEEIRRLGLSHVFSLVNENTTAATAIKETAALIEKAAALLFQK